MLQELRCLHPELPSDSRTLLRTPRMTTVKTVRFGHYIHFGLQECLGNSLKMSSLSSTALLQLQLHVDGMTVFKSSKLQLWPIIGRVLRPLSSLFIIGIFCGKQKPQIDEYLHDVVCDLKSILKDGFVTKEGRVIPVEIAHIICDAPARAFIKQTKQHSGYFSCDRCEIEGVYESGKVIFPLIRHNPRSDFEFRTRKQEEHHTGQSPLESLPIDMILTFPYDYMHVVCLGFMKRLIAQWKGGSIASNIRQSFVTFQRINHKLNRCSSALTCEFPRKCRDFDDFERWKATELRQFLLYLGPVVLRSDLNENQYANFLTISVCFYILSSEIWCRHYVDYVEQKLYNALQEYADIYGQSELTYNVHCITHICGDIATQGCLNNYSAFPFESYLGSIRRLIRSPTMPASQIFRRIQEHWLNVLPAEECIDDTGANHSRNSRKDGCFLYKTVKFSKYFPNNCIVCGSQPGVIVNFNNTHILFSAYRNPRAFYNTVIKSPDLYIFECDNKLLEPVKKPINSILSKACGFVDEDTVIVYPILHTLDIINK